MSQLIIINTNEINRSISLVFTVPPVIILYHIQDGQRNNSLEDIPIKNEATDVIVKEDNQEIIHIKNEPFDIIVEEDNQEIIHIKNEPFDIIVEEDNQEIIHIKNEPFDIIVEEDNQEIIHIKNEPTDVIEETVYGKEGDIKGDIDVDCDYDHDLSESIGCDYRSNEDIDCNYCLDADISCDDDLYDYIMHTDFNFNTDRYSPTLETRVQVEETYQHDYLHDKEEIDHGYLYDKEELHHDYHQKHIDEVNKIIEYLKKDTKEH